MTFHSVTFTLSATGVVSDKWLSTSARQTGHCASATARDKHESSRHTRLGRWTNKRRPSIHHCSVHLAPALSRQLASHHAPERVPAGRRHGLPITTITH